MVIFPNPVENALTVTLNVATGNDASLSIINLSGKILVNKTLKVSPGINLYKSDEVSKLLPGSYVVKMCTGTDCLSQIMIKK